VYIIHSIVVAITRVGRGRYIYCTCESGTSTIQLALISR